MRLLDSWNRKVYCWNCRSNLSIREEDILRRDLADKEISWFGEGKHYYVECCNCREVIDLDILSVPSTTMDRLNSQESQGSLEKVETKLLIKDYLLAFLTGYFITDLIRFFLP